MPPKSLRSGAGGAGGLGSADKKALEKLTERVGFLEKRCSTLLLHQTYFKILDEWIQCMFGAEIFPKLSDIAKESKEDGVEEDLAEDPFYEVHLLHQRVNFIEEELQGMGIDIPPIKRPKKEKDTFKGEGTAVGTRRGVLRKRAFVEPTPPPPPTVTAKVSRPPVLKPATAAATRKASKDDKGGGGGGGGGGEEKEDVKGKEGEEEEKDNPPPVLEEQVKTERKEKEGDDGDVEMEEVSPPPSNEAPPASQEKEEGAEGSQKEVKKEPKEGDEEMPVDGEEEDEEDFEEKLDIDDIEYAVGRYAEKKIRETIGGDGRRGRGRRTEKTEADSGSEKVTYTTRGRKHTLPRRYAEFTGHDNVASILKSQGGRRSEGGRSVKKEPGTKTPKTPAKPKAPPKAVTPKKADGSRPECVYDLITTVQGKEVDDQGNVVLWDPIPNVKVNQQQLISVIFRSNGMATRLTRKLTTLVFEDQVLANTSPFGTKYYSERLPPEPLEAMVEFISNSGFDPDYTKKKIYMVVGQVCNEARAGRVRKLMPSGSSSAASNTASDGQQGGNGNETDSQEQGDGEIKTEPEETAASADEASGSEKQEPAAN